MGCRGRRFESCQPDQFPIREALQNTSSCKASNFFALRGLPPSPMVPPCTLPCITFRMHDNFPNQTYTATKAGSLILPPFGNINRENYHKIHSLPLANKQKNPGYLPGSCHSYSLPFPLRPARYSASLPWDRTNRNREETVFIALQAGKSYTPPVQTSPFPLAFMPSISFLNHLGALLTLWLLLCCGAPAAENGRILMVTEATFPPTNSGRKRHPGH